LFLNSKENSDPSTEFITRIHPGNDETVPALYKESLYMFVKHQNEIKDDRSRPTIIKECIKIHDEEEE